MSNTAPDAAMGRWIPNDSTFGARLALVRWQMRWNQKEAALACGIPQNSWRGWEEGRNPHDLADAARKISARTGVDLVWLTLGSHDEGPRPAVSRNAGLPGAPGGTRTHQPTGLTVEGQEDGTGRLASVHPLTPRPRIRHLAGTASAVVIPLRRRSA